MNYFSTFVQELSEIKRTLNAALGEADASTKINDPVVKKLLCEKERPGEFATTKAFHLDSNDAPPPTEPATPEDDEKKPSYKI